MFGPNQLQKDFISQVIHLSEYKLSPNDQNWLIHNKSSPMPKALEQVVNNHYKGRYRFGLVTPRDQVIYDIFHVAYQNNSASLIKSAEKKAQKRFYPLSKRVILITIPRGISKLLNSYILKVPVAFMVFVISISILNLHVPRLESFIYKKLTASSKLVLLADRVAGCALCMIPLMFVYSLITEIILRLPQIPYVTSFATRYRIKPFSICAALSLGAWQQRNFLGDIVAAIALFTWNQLGAMSALLQARADKADATRLQISKKQAYALWKHTLAL